MIKEQSREHRFSRCHEIVKILEEKNKGSFDSIVYATMGTAPEVKDLSDSATLISAILQVFEADGLITINE